MDKYFEIIKMIIDATGTPITDPEIDCSINFLNSAIAKIKDKIIAHRIQNQVKYLIQRAENKAFDRSSAFLTLKRVTENIATAIPEISDKLCQEQGIPEFRFREPVDMTPEEQEKLDADNKAYAAEFYKKNKKKPKNEEEERFIWEEVKKGIVENLKNSIQSSLDGIERELEKKKIEYKLSNYERMDYSKYETLSRKRCITDETMSENTVLLRLDLDAKLSPIQYEEIEKNIVSPPQPELKNEDESEENPEPKQPQKIIIKKPLERKVLDAQCLQDAKHTIQYLIERSASRILISGSLGPALGYKAMEYTLEPLVKAYKGLFDQEIMFKEECEFDNFAKMIEDNDIPEGSTVLLENLNFNPSEYGFSINPENGDVKLTSKKAQTKFRKRLSTYGRIFVNDAPKDSLTEATSICGLKAEHMLLGLRMKDMINKLSAFFMYSGYPFAAILGGDDYLDKILLINSLIDTCTHIYLFGHLGLYFMSALGVKLAGFNHDNIYYEAVHKVMAKAKEHGVEIILPQDLVVIKSMPKKEPIVEEKKEEAQKVEVKKEEKKQTGKKQAKEEKKVEEKKEEIKTPEQLKQEAELREKQRLEEEKAWITEALKNPRKLTIPEKDLFKWFLENKEKAKKAAEAKPVEEKKEEKKESKKEGKKEQKKEEKKEEKKVEVPPVEQVIPKDPMQDLINQDEWIIGYSEQTIALLLEAVGKPLRLLLDGELDLKERTDTKWLTRMMYDLLLKRKAEIPSHRKKRKLTLIHGLEAKNSIISIAETIKAEEKEKARKARLAARSEDDEGEPEPEEPQEEEDKKGFDISTICTDALGDGPFTMKLMQGENIPGLLNIEERPRPTRDELECDLSILEDI